MKQMGIQFTYLGLIKLFQTEIEKIIVVNFSSSSIAAQFSLVTAFGGLIPRFIYNPIDVFSFFL